MKELKTAKQAREFLDNIISANNKFREMCNARYSNVICCEQAPNFVQMYSGIEVLAELLGIPLNKKEWSGNKQLNRNFDYLSFNYNGTEIMQLKEKED